MSTSSIRSMTGYGRGECVTPAGTVTAEIRSVNHRYAELSVRLPRPLLPFEQEIRRTVTDRLRRGKIDLSVGLEGGSLEGGRPTVDLALAKGYHDALRSLGQALGIPEPVTLDLIARQKDVITLTAASPDAEPLMQGVRQAISTALDAIDRMRAVEGEALVADIISRLDRLESLRGSVAARAPLVPREAMERMRERIARLLEGVDLDPQRLAQEIALFADRCDVTEELTRFASHLSQFRESLASPEPVGRRLDFLVQELNREINTIGSKANDREITACVVEMKGELEKIREQLQNIE